MTLTRTLVLLLLAGALGFAPAFGCAAPNPRRQLSSVIAHALEDPTQRRLMRELLNQRDEELRVFAQESARMRDDLQAALTDRTLDREAAAARLSAALNVWTLQRERMVGYALRMRDVVGPTDWKQIAEADLAVLLASRERLVPPRTH